MLRAHVCGIWWELYTNAAVNTHVRARTYTNVSIRNGIHGRKETELTSSTSHNPNPILNLNRTDDYHIT